MPVLDASALDSDPQGVALLRSLMTGGKRVRRPRMHAFAVGHELGQHTPPVRRTLPIDRHSDLMIPVAALAPAI